MARSITVRDVPDEVADALAARAASSGRSLQEYLKGHLVDLVRRPDLDVWLESVREHKAGTPMEIEPGAILEARTADRR